MRCLLRSRNEFVSATTSAGGHKSDPGRSFPARGFELVVKRGVEDRLVASKEGVGLGTQG
jgi:hypothetical protein